MTSSLTWQAAHHWLRGYSDAKADRPNDKHALLHEGYEDVYDRGYNIGSGKLTEPALVGAGGGCDG